MLISEIWSHNRLVYYKSLELYNSTTQIQTNTVDSYDGVNFSKIMIIKKMMARYGISSIVSKVDQGLILLTWINFNPCMDK